MRFIPLQVGPLEFNVFVVLEDKDLEKMKKLDPAQLRMEDLGHPWQSLMVKTVLIGYASPEDARHVDKLVLEGRGAHAFEFLSRGFRYPADLSEKAKPDNGLPGA